MVSLEQASFWGPAVNERVILPPPPLSTGEAGNRPTGFCIGNGQAFFGAFPFSVLRLTPPGCMGHPPDHRLKMLSHPLFHRILSPSIPAPVPSGRRRGRCPDTGLPDRLSCGTPRRVVGDCRHNDGSQLQPNPPFARRTIPRTPGGMEWCVTLPHILILCLKTSS